MRFTPHGTYSGYNYWGCRCQECRDARTAYDRKRAKRGVCRDCSVQVQGRTRCDVHARMNLEHQRRFWKRQRGDE